MTQSSVCVRLVGGLGNQMFGAAAGLALAARTQSALKFDLESFASDKKREFALEPFQIDADLIDTLATGRRTVVGAFFPKRNKLQKWKQPSFHFDSSFDALPGDVEISGYFQSPRFFSGYENIVRSAFELRPLLSEKGKLLAEAAQKSGQRSIAVHVRRGDYISDSKAAAVHGILGPDFYDRAVDILGRLGEQPPHIFVVSDDPSAATVMFKSWPNVTFAEGTSAFDDMYLISQCHHRIIANSSFSWWGAWLSDLNSGFTIAPRMWFARHRMLTTSTCDLFPEEWIAV